MTTTNIQKIDEFMNEDPSKYGIYYPEYIGYIKSSLMSSNRCEAIDLVTLQRIPLDQYDKVWNVAILEEDYNQIHELRLEDIDVYDVVMDLSINMMSLAPGFREMALVAELHDLEEDEEVLKRILDVVSTHMNLKPLPVLRYAVSAVMPESIPNGLNTIDRHERYCEGF